MRAERGPLEKWVVGVKIKDTLFTMDSKRDTKFYDFYDDLLAEYGIEESDHGIYDTQQALSIRL